MPTMTSENRPTSLRFEYHAVSDRDTQKTLFTITRTATNFPAFLFKKSLLRLIHTESNKLVGTVRFHSKHLDLDLEVNGRKMILSPAEVGEARWIFEPTSPSSKPQKWLWGPDPTDETRSVVLVDMNDHSKVFARVKQDSLSFGSLDLTDETMNDIVITTLALFEFVRRKSKLETVDLGVALHARDRFKAGVPAYGAINGNPHVGGSAVGFAAAASGGGC